MLIIYKQCRVGNVHNKVTLPSHRIQKKVFSTCSTHNIYTCILQFEIVHGTRGVFWIFKYILYCSLFQWKGNSETFNELRKWSIPHSMELVRIVSECGTYSSAMLLVWRWLLHLHHNKQLHEIFISYKLCQIAITLQQLKSSHKMIIKYDASRVSST